MCFPASDLEDVSGHPGYQRIKPDVFFKRKSAKERREIADTRKQQCVTLGLKPRVVKG